MRVSWASARSVDTCEVISIRGSMRLAARSPGFLRRVSSRTWGETAPEAGKRLGNGLV